MRIVLSIPGHLKTVPMNGYILDTLLRMDHQVKVHRCERATLYEGILKVVSRRRFHEQKDRRLTETIRNFKPDLFLAVFGFDHNLETLETIKSCGTTTACWWLNDPFQLERSLTLAPAYDFYFTNSSGTLPTYRRQGVRNASFLPLASEPSVHQPSGPVPTCYDVGFAGDWGPVREEILTTLAEEFGVAILGPWRKKLARRSRLQSRIVKDGFFSPQEMVRFFAQSRIVLNLHSWFGTWDYGVNPRLFEASACKAFQICDWKEEIPELYVPGEEIVLFRNLAELRESIRRHLSDDPSRAEIAARACARTHREHTYEARLAKLLATCFP